MPVIFSAECCHLPNAEAAAQQTITTFRTYFRSV